MPTELFKPPYKAHLFTVNQEKLHDSVYSLVATLTVDILPSEWSPVKIGESIYKVHKWYVDADSGALVVSVSDVSQEDFLVPAFELKKLLS